MRTRATRRHHVAKAKMRTKRKLAQWAMPTDAATVGRAAAQHNTCPCHTCTDPDPARERKRGLFRDLVKLEAA